jgi:WD40 repeat protein
MSHHADLEISLHRHETQSDQVRLRLRLPGHDAPRDSSALVPRFDLDSLGALATDPVRYGQALTDALLADEALKLFLAQARALAADRGIPLRTRLYLDPHAPELHELRWETLRDPRPGASAFLFTDETVPFSRYLSSADWRPVTTQPRGDLKALVVVADPLDRDEWDLAAVDVAGELARARAGLGALELAALYRPEGAGDPDPGLPILGPPTLRNLVACLRDGYDILYLICHGKLLPGGEGEDRRPVPWIWLEDDEGNADPVPAVEATVSGSPRPGLVTRLGKLARLPRLVVLASCQSGGGGREWASTDGGDLAALGPRLAEIGIPAVVAMQDDVAMETVARFMPTFFRELDRDGQIDRALAAARAELVDAACRDWWVPVLYTRLGSGRLFAAEAEAAAILAAFSVPFDRNPRFVGREAELAQLHRLLQEGPTATGGPPVGITPAGISGMGGIGKTQLAVEYAHRYRDAYPGGVFWVNAARVQDWSRELVDLADRVGLRPADPSSPDRTGQMVAALSRHLQQQAPALLIFDNVTDPRHLQTVRLGPGLTPFELGGVLLFTTRRREMPPGLATLDVKVLPRETSQQMILAARPEAAGDPDLDRLCDTLGHLPLALELAAAALRHRSRLSLSAYLQNLSQLGAEPLHEKALVTPGDLATYYEVSLTPALKAQWAALDDAGPRGRDARLLLRAAAQLAEAELIPVARLGLLAGLRDDEDGLEEPLSDALRELEANSLVEPIQDRRLRLHPLVRDFAAHQTPEEGVVAFRQSLAANLAAVYGDIAVLEDHCARRGIDALQRDLLSALGLLPSPPSTLHSPLSNLHPLLRLLKREAHNLRGWDPDQRPAFFPQQVFKSAAALALPELAAGAEARLARARAPYLRLDWQAGVQSLALERTLTGHDDLVNAVAVTPDGRRAVSAAADWTLRVWDLETGGELARLTGHERGFLAHPAGHEGGVLAVAVTPDVRRAVSASEDQTLRVWDLETGRQLAYLTGHEGRVNAVVVTTDGRRAVSASDDGTLRVWDLAAGEEMVVLGGHEDVVGGGDLFFKPAAARVLAVAVTPDGRRAVSGSSDGMLHVWDLETGGQVAVWRGHEDKEPAVGRVPAVAASVLAVAVTPDGQRAVSASDDGTLRVWDLASGEEVAVLRGHGDRVRTVAVTPDERHVVSGSDDGTLRVWDISSGPNAGLASGEEVTVLRGHGDRVRTVAVTADGRRAVSGSNDRTLRVWDITPGLNAGLATGEEVAVPHGHEGWVHALAVTQDGRRAVSGSGDRTLRVWDLETGGELARLTGHGGSVVAVALTPDGRRAVSGSDDSTLRVWNIAPGLNAGLASGEEVAMLRGHESLVTAVAVTPDGQLAVWGSNDGALRVWDLASGEEAVLGSQEDDFYQDDVDETFWASAFLFPDPVLAVTVTPDGRRAMSASADGTLRVWDLASSEEVAVLRGLGGWVPAQGRFGAHEAPVLAVAVTPDGRRAVSASDDGTLRLWEISSGLHAGLASGEEVAVLCGHGDRVRTVAVARDGRRAVSGSDDGTLRVWDLDTGEELAVVALEGSLFCATLAPDGTTIVAGDRAGNVYCLRYVEPVGGWGAGSLNH